MGCSSSDLLSPSRSYRTNSNAPSHHLNNTNNTNNTNNGRTASRRQQEPPLRLAASAMTGNGRNASVDGVVNGAMIVNPNLPYPSPDVPHTPTQLTTAVAQAVAMTAAVSAGAPATPSSLSGGYRRLADARSGYIHTHGLPWSRSSNLLQPPSSSPPRSTTPPLYVLASPFGNGALSGRSGGGSVSPGPILAGIASPTYIVAPKSPSLRLPSPVPLRAGWSSLLPPPESPNAARALAAAASVSMTALDGKSGLRTRDSIGGGVSIGMTPSSPLLSPPMSTIPTLPPLSSRLSSASSSSSQAMKLPLLTSNSQVPLALESAVLQFLDLGDIVPLTMICGWQRKIVIRYLTYVRHVRLGAHHQFGVPNAQQVISFTLLFLLPKNLTLLR
jgi:hypothetical protein